jgi:eukaryotic-like serine/threonine-protein kinase
MEPEQRRQVDPDSAQLAPGYSVGPYRLEALIGEGGMGQVFRAVDTRLQRTVAIKFLLPERTAGAHKRRFIREAQAASALNHPNIVTLYDISSHEGRDFLVMEYVCGNTLTELIGDGMPPDRLFHIGEQVASALAAAHEAGILHRDIKPANIMVTPGRHVKVLDFGIARMLSPDSRDPDDQMPTETQLTTPGTVVGTVPYMPPEQARGAAVDARSDIFSLGCLLYEAATGKLPFRGGNALAVMHQILTVNPARPGSLRADLPPAFDRLVTACLEKDPARRPSSAADVAQSLRALCHTDDEHPRTRAGRPSVAVLPFRFRTAQPEDRFLSLALAEAVTNRLASSCELVVRPVASVLRYGETDVEWTQVARELNVDHVVEGTIQKMGSKVRVLVQASRACDASPYHSSRHDGDMGDLFSLQDRIADAVFGAFLPGTKTDAEPAVPPTENPLAYELYLRAAERIVHMNRYDTGSAIEMFSRAVEIDPDFADAWGRLAQAYSQMGMHVDSDPKWFDRAEHAIARALELDPVQCDAHCTRGVIMWSPSRGFQNLAALRAINAALKINPGRYTNRQLRGAILFHLGFHEQADRDMQESLLANPAYALAIASRGVIAQYRGDYAEAHECYLRALAVEPTLLHANIFAPTNILMMGRVSEAKDSFRKARQIIPEESMLTAIEGLIAAHEGDFARAEALADQACSTGSKSLTHTHHTWHCAAGVYAICGKPEKAVAEVSRCLTMGLPNYRLFTTDPNLKSLHDDPAFTAVMTAMRREYDRVATLVAPAS